MLTKSLLPLMGESLVTVSLFSYLVTLLERDSSTTRLPR
jgi:hypothetical protein